MRPRSGRETGLGHERYIAIEHMEKVRPETGREAGLGHVRRDCFSVARHIGMRREASQVRRDYLINSFGPE